MIFSTTCRKYPNQKSHIRQQSAQKILHQRLGAPIERNQGITSGSYGLTECVSSKKNTQQAIIH